MKDDGFGGRRFAGATTTRRSFATKPVTKDFLAGLVLGVWSVVLVVRALLRSATPVQL